MPVAISVDVQLSHKKEKIDQLFESIKNIDWQRIGEFAEDVATESNRGAVLAGIDKDGAKMVPVKYRPKRGPRVKIEARKFSMRRRNQRGFGTTAGAMKSTSGDNLTPAEYSVLRGPPLAPRYSASRVITNFVTKSTVNRTGFNLEFGWADVLSAKGKPFLKAHFEGRGKLPRRDLRGLQPQAKRRIVNEVKAAITIAFGKVLHG